MKIITRKIRTNLQFSIADCPFTGSPAKYYKIAAFVMTRVTWPLALPGNNTSPEAEQKIYFWDACS
jgi:hypothetical protein